MIKLKGWRTFAFNALAALLPILDLAEFRAVLPEPWLPWYALGVVLGNMYLRTITTTPPGRGE